MSEERHIVFGTAGHVDHGKSSLVRALTGTDPDRWAEEKAREMTIDIGFAFLKLPGFEEPAAIVDVPGHEMFVRNMVTGATGIDAAIFVVAADEGVMPQTLEHLDVLLSLDLPSGVIALTKADRASAERIEEVTAQLRALVEGTFLEKARIFPVSSVTRQGLPELMDGLGAVAQEVAPRPVEGIYRHPIDRVFTMKGAGTVITGTIISGSLKAGEKVELLPQRRTLRVRGLQVHNESAGRIFAGQRAAVNLADIEKEELGRGDVLVTPGAMQPTLMIDARINLSVRATKPLAQRRRLRIHHGTKEVMARIVLLEADELGPGESALCQLRLETELVAAKGDRFVVRSYSPMLVIGGGVVIDAHPPKRKKSSGAEGVAEREALPVEEIIVALLERAGAKGLVFGDLQTQCGLAESELRGVLEELQQAGQVVPGRRDMWLSVDAAKEIEEGIVGALAGFHHKEPIRMWAPLNEIVGAAARANTAQESVRVALESLTKRGEIEVSGNRIRLCSHRPQWGGQLAAAKSALVTDLLRSGLAVPSVKELALRIRVKESEMKRVLAALVESGEVHALAEDIFLHPQVLEKCREEVLGFLRKHGKMNIAQARELLGASRKYLLPLLEAMDRQGLTRREGDFRVLGANSAKNNR